MEQQPSQLLAAILAGLFTFIIPLFKEKQPGQESRRQRLLHLPHDTSPPSTPLLVHQRDHTQATFL